MPFTPERLVGDYTVREARREDADGARTVMLDTFYRVFGHGFTPRWHGDVIDMESAYFTHPRQSLFVATKGNEVVATAAVRADGPKSPPHPEWLTERYPSGSTAQIFRVYVREEHRRHGLARALVDLTCAFIAETPGYETIYLHTNPAVEGAAEFWRSVATEVYDGRTDPRYSSSVHFEIPMPEATSRPAESQIPVGVQR
jgi:ribosomal protein S18 acetylase RimI-like enzyme